MGILCKQISTISCYKIYWGHLGGSVGRMLIPSVEGRWFTCNKFRTQGFEFEQIKELVPIEALQQANKEKFYEILKNILLINQ